ncbi:type IV pilus modification protein PilV [Shewanella gelidimarina]|uniref:type IV pilus modification protein PilV n=1 Tax=Shewanella gelidimarina TaxID=56813 RepID=UPI00200D9393|nr:type IV pilus modification protein PilV [Shewanella gelidimarina]MCL1056979.1 type IV pilus modification protein PilV [Shewanella gelidimarina]
MKNQQKGLSLIEVMVSLVILVVGLIGIFNLHIIAKRGSFESFQQTQAAYLANDIVNRMKLNKAQLPGYAGTYEGKLTLPSAVCDVAVNVNIVCSNGESLAWDLYQWEQNINGASEQLRNKNVGGLDSPTACISVTGNAVMVVMTWRGISETSDGAAKQNSFVKGCGSSDKRRRIFIVETVII